MMHMSLNELIGVINAVTATRMMDAAIYRFYEFSDSNDNKVCPECKALDDLIMTRREIEARFPYLEKVSKELWLPHVHPNCRCELRFEEEEEDEDVKKEYWKKK